MAKEAVSFSLPFWARAALFAARLLPITRPYAAWIELALAVVSALPKHERVAVKKEFVTAQRMAKAGNKKPLEQVTKKYWKKHCEGSMCPADVKRI